MIFYRLKEVPFLYPVISFELTSVPVQVQSRRLRARWTPEFAQDLQYYAAFDPVAVLEVLTEEFQPRQGIASRYANRMVDNRYYDTLIIGEVIANKYTGVKFGKLKPISLHRGDTFLSNILPVARQAVARLRVSDPHMEVVESVYTSLRHWAELIDRQNRQPIFLSSRKRSDAGI